MHESKIRFARPWLDRFTSGESARDAANFGSLKRQIIHQSFGIKNEPDDRTRDLIGINRAANAQRDHRHRSVHTDLPPSPAIEAGKGFVGHKHDDNGALLHTELKTE